MLQEDTIAAISTALGEGAIAVLRVSGPEARSIGNRLFRGGAGVDLTKATPRLAHYGAFVDEQTNTELDRGLATVFAAPASYTGEDLVEFSCHGGVLVTRKLYETLLQLGCRAAEPGEFTQRAFLNGKMDLTQAEAVMDLIQAQTSLALRAANEQLRGDLGTEAQALREALIGIAAHLEAYIDFPEEDIDPDSGAAISKRLGDVMKRLQTLLASADRGRILREGARAVICGEPNVGKSSLLNVLLGFERAIVSDTAGTTRDTIEEVINLQGIPLRLIDTAGLHDSSDDIECLGMQRTRDALATADVVIEVIDGHVPQHPSQLSPSSETDHAPTWIRLLNKADLGLHPEHVQATAKDNGIPFSCTEHTGLEELTEALRDALLSQEERAQAQLVAINARHQSCLQRALTSCQQAAAALDTQTAPEFVALDLREALEAVGEVVGKVDVEEILGEIFGSFCIGK